MFEQNTLYFQKMYPDAKIFTKAHQSDAGYDIYAYESMRIESNSKELISTGIKIALPNGYYGRVASRSSMSLKNLEVGAGVIDNGYRGEIKVVLRNFSNIPYYVNKNDKIAQLIVTPYGFDIKHEEVEDINQLQNPVLENDEKIRNDGGFGSTGI